VSSTRSLVLSIVAIVVLTAAALGATLASGLSPQLGLDLQGGVSVVLQPRIKASESVLDQAIQIIQSRVGARYAVSAR
jgi:preprotein translocase subunit SecD